MRFLIKVQIFMIAYNFKFIEISPEVSLAMRPDLPLLKDPTTDLQKLQIFLKKVKDCVSQIDFNELNLLVEKKSTLPQIPIYITYGIEPLYDAWTISTDNETKIFLNANGFEYNFEIQDALIVVHELVHLLLANMLPEMDSQDFLGQYHSIMMDEGLAHFLSFPYRERILNRSSHYTDKRNWAEKKF